MTNPQVEAARRVFGKFKSLNIKWDVVTNPDRSETFTPFLMANGTFGEPVIITRDTPVSEVTRLFTQALKPLA